MSNLTIKGLEESLQMLREVLGHRWTDRERWKDVDERKKMHAEDRKKGRGMLMLNPDAINTDEWAGRITEKDGKEFRIVAEPALRGMRVKDESGQETDVPVAGFWFEVPKFDPFVPLLSFGVDL